MDLLHAPYVEAIADFRGGSIALAAIVVLNDLLGNRLVERREFRASTDRCPADPDDRVHLQGEVLTRFDSAEVLHRDPEPLGELLPGDAGRLPKLAQPRRHAPDEGVEVVGHPSR
jgi:hypothetical protein